MAVDYEAKTTKELETIIANCQRLNKTADPRCIAAAEELKRRNPTILDIDKSRAAILTAARARQFLSYSQLAQASGMQWTATVRREMPSHLWALISHAHDNGWPMLSAIVVDKPNVAVGNMQPGALKGFIKAAHDLGRRDIDADDATFLREEQKRLFAYAKDHSDL